MRFFEKAQANWPKTQTTPDGGVEISGKYRSINTNPIAATVGLVGFGGCAWLVFQGDFAAALVVLFVGSAFLVILNWLLPAKLAIKVYHERIELPGFFGWRRYSRNIPIEFRVEHHHKALEEEALARRTGSRKKPFYREAIEAVMQYGEKRVTIAEMRQRDLEMARALVIRLQNVCDSVDLAFDEVMAESSNPARDVGEFGRAPHIR